MTTRDQAYLEGRRDAAREVRRNGDAYARQIADKIDARTDEIAQDLLRPVVAAQTAKPIGLNSQVTFQLGGSTVVGTVMVDHGPIGPGGVRLLRVRAVLDDLDPAFEADVREDRLTALG